MLGRPGAAAQLILFDGFCVFCDGVCRFLIERSTPQRLRLAALQSPAGQAIARAAGIEPGPLSTMVLIDERGRASVKSTAAVRAFAMLGGPWRLLLLLLYLPPRLRDPCYSAFGRRRYRWFGRTDACRVPGPDEAGYFVSEAEAEQWRATVAARRCP